MKVAEIFTDNMVLQRRKDIYVWGTGEDKVKVTLDDVTVEASCSDGKWDAVLPAREAGGPYTLVVESGVEKVEFSNVLVGEVWIAGGQSNMEMPLFLTYDGYDYAEKSKNDQIRLLTVPQRVIDRCDYTDWHFQPSDLRKFEWKECCEESAMKFSAIGYHFARIMQEYLDVPVGLISCNIGGTKCECWLDPKKIREEKDLSYIMEAYDKRVAEWDDEKNLANMNKFIDDMQVSLSKSENVYEMGRRLGPDTMAVTNQLTDAPDYNLMYNTPLDFNAVPGCLYKAMVKQTAPYSARGFLWYQGESNSGYDESMFYERLFNKMVENWREDWHDDNAEMPWLTVELAPFFLGQWNPADEGDNYAYLREQQLKATVTGRNTHMVTIGDIGDMWNIHPCRKREVAERLALAARKTAYGDDVEFMGPTFKSMEIKDNKCYITFDHVGEGLQLGEITKVITNTKKTCSWSTVNDVQITGDDNIYREAEAEIVSKDTVCVWSSQVWGDDIKVRMGWRNHHMLNLFNSYGLPAAPFRTGK